MDIIEAVEEIEEVKLILSTLEKKILPPDGKFLFCLHTHVSPPLVSGWVRSQKPRKTCEFELLADKLVVVQRGNMLKEIIAIISDFYDLPITFLCEKCKKEVDLLDEDGFCLDCRREWLDKLSTPRG